MEKPLAKLPHGCDVKAWY